MQITHLEAFSLGKAEDGYSEDRLIRTAHHFGVLDGSRGPGYGEADVITAIMDDAVSMMGAVPKDITLEALVEAFTALVRARKIEARFDDLRRTGGFVFCLYSAHHHEIWRVGDCKFRLRGETNAKFWRTEELCAETRAMMIRSMRYDGLSEAEIMAHEAYDQLIAAPLSCEANYLNRDDDDAAFGAIIGTAVPAPFIERYPAQSGRLVITSDGYPALFDTLADSEAHLAALLTQDPLCIGINLQCKGLGPGRVSFDDRSYISADLG
ncbi:hypothetical protein [Cohaesibacter intestini]|uniref:hypothetical protein n=1 Tax=Cohaesibacter intestini TaxID=2211145 RepID=UPI000DE83F12|nr:hypothetical protein [Cohaesibacter intestini]